MSKLQKLQFQLSLAIILLFSVLISGIFIFSPISIKQVANAITTGNYTQNAGDPLDEADWNLLANDFVHQDSGTASNLTVDDITITNSCSGAGCGGGGGGDIFTNWGRSDCPAGDTVLYNGFTFGKKWDEPYGSGEVLCIQSGLAGPAFASAIRDKLWLVTSGAAEYTPAGVVPERAMKCATCYNPSGICYENIGNNGCSVGFTQAYSGYIMGGVTGIDNPNNRNNNSRSCVNSDYDGDTGISNVSNISVYAGTAIVDNVDVPAYATDSYIRCSVCCME